MFLKHCLVSVRISFNSIFLPLQLRYQHGLGTPDLRQTLPNLKNFMEHGLLVRWWVPLFLILRNCNVHNHPEKLFLLPHYSTPAFLVFFCNKISEEKERQTLYFCTKLQSGKGTWSTLRKGEGSGSIVWTLGGWLGKQSLSTLLRQTALWFIKGRDIEPLTLF